MRTDILSTIFYLLMAALLINGCVHSCKKHKDDPDWVQHSPLAIYRGAEYFWHDDFAGVDWDKRLKADAFVMFDFISRVGNTVEAESLSNEIEKFSNKIKNYPNEKKEYLKQALERFIKYSMAVSTDMISYLNELKEGEDVIPKKWNKTSKAVQDTLVSVYEFNELEPMSKSIDSVMARITIQHRFADISSDELDKMKNIYEQSKITQFNTYMRFFKMIFDTEFPKSDIYL